MEQVRCLPFGDLKSKMYISSEVRFYTIGELMGMPGWSEPTVQRLFNDPKFPAANYGRGKVVEAHALIDYRTRNTAGCFKELYDFEHSIDEDRYIAIGRV